MDIARRLRQAREYIEKHQIFGADGFDLDDEEILEFANELLLFLDSF